MDLDNIYKKAEDGLLDRKNMLIFPWEAWHFRDWRTQFLWQRGKERLLSKRKSQGIHIGFSEARKGLEIS